jgi:hypothetical protein
MSFFTSLASVLATPTPAWLMAFIIGGLYLAHHLMLGRRRQSMLDQLLLSAGLFKLQELLISMLQVFAKHSSRAHRATDKLSVLRKERSSWNHSSSVALSTSCIAMVRSTMVSLV